MGLTTMELSVKVNDVFGDDVAYGEMIRRSESAGAEAVGFRPWYDDDLDVVIDAADQTDLDIAYLSGGSPDVDGPEFPLTDPDVRESAVEQLQRAIEVAANADGAFLNVIPGRWHDTIDPAVQHRSIVTALRRVAGQAERADVTLLVEPINSRVDHPGIYLTSSHEGYKITDAVDSPNVKLLYDIYHQQISEGNLICNLREHVDEIAHVHVAGVPGRHEPGSGEIDYPAVLSALADAGYEGYVECEFVPVGDAESAIRDVGAMLETAR
jgi:hydroxypyruvate isomerase